MGVLESRSAGAARRSLRAALALACGLGLAYATSRAGAVAPRAPAPVAWWIADRDAHQLVGLDRDLHVAARCALRWPVMLAARTDGGVWVARALEGGPRGAHALECLDALGRSRARFELPAPRALCAPGGEGAWMLIDAPPEPPLQPEQPESLEQPEPAHLLRIELEAGPRRLASFAGARHLCARSSGELVLGADDGRLWLTDLAGGVRAERQLEGGLAALAPGPRAGQCWALQRAPDARLWLLGAALEPLGVLRTGLAGGCLAAEPGSERVWVADARRRHVRRFGAAGRLELDWTDVPLAGLRVGAALRDEHAPGGGGALWLAPGALLRVDARGTLAPGQGGFGHAHDLARVPGG